jgi:hypothetical protein
MRGMEKHEKNQGRTLVAKRMIADGFGNDQAKNSKV